jgi:hypothetical protein
MREEIQQLVASGRTEEAIQKLIQGGVSDAILLSSRFNQAKKQYSMGMVSFTDWNLIQSQINFGVLELAGKVQSGGGVAIDNSGNNNTSPTNPPPDRTVKPKVFISYNQNDSFAMRAVKAHLEDNGIQVFVDIQDMGVGDSISAFIDKALADNQFIMSIISRNSLQSGWVNQEFSAALLLGRFGKKWLPVLLDNAAFDNVFINDAQDGFDKRITEQKKLLKAALQKNRDTRPFTDELERLTDLKNDFGKNIQAIKAHLAADVSGALFEVGMGKVVRTIKGTTTT